MATSNSRIVGLLNVALLLMAGLVVVLCLRVAFDPPTRANDQALKPPSNVPDSNAKKNAHQPIAFIEVPLPAPPGLDQEGEAEFGPVTHNAVLGPAIELVWPKGKAQRGRLYGYLYECRGMRLGVLYQGRVELLEPASELGAELNLGGVARLVSGALSPREQAMYSQSQHPGQPVRLFPAVFDQRVLRALRRALGSEFGRAKTLRAGYGFQNGRLSLSDIRLDGKQIAGVVVQLGSECQKS